MTTDIYQTVTNRIIADLEAGTPTWLKPWKDGAPAVGIRAHDCKKSGCGPVCTAFEW